MKPRVLKEGQHRLVPVSEEAFKLLQTVLAWNGAERREDPGKRTPGSTEWRNPGDPEGEEGLSP